MLQTLHQQSVTLLVFDQFEQFFLHVPYATRQTFLREFKECLSDLSVVEMNVVFAIRRDFLGQMLAEFEQVMPTHFSQESKRLDLYPLSKAEAREAIMNPLKNLAVKIGYDQTFVDEILLTRLLEQTSDQVGIEPPHLQIVCNQLYEAAYRRLSIEVDMVQINVLLYDELGGVEKILQTYLDEVVKEITADQPTKIAVVRSLLKAMIETSGTRCFISIVDLQRALPDVGEVDIDLFLGQLQDRRVLETQQREGEWLFSLSHEIMVPQVASWYDEREWERKKAAETLERGLKEWASSKTLLNEKQFSHIRQWLPQWNEAAEALLVKSEAAVAEQKRKEKRQSRLKQALVSLVFIAAIVAVWFAYRASENEKVATEQKNVANEQRQHAEKQALISEIEAQSIDALAQFQAGEIESLLSAMEAGQKLRAFLNKNHIQKLQNYPSTRPLLTLQTILNNIREKNLFKVDEEQVNSVDFSPDGQMIATGGYDGTVRLFTLSGQEITQWQAYPQWVERLEFSPDGRFILTGNNDNNRNEYNLWELSGESTAIQSKQIAEWKNEALYDINLDFSFSSDGKKIAGILGGSVRLWDFSGKQITQIKPDPTVEDRQIVWGSLLDNQWHSKGANCLDFSPDGKQLVIGSALGDVQIYDLSEYQKIKQFKAYGKAVEAISFSPNGQYILTRGIDQTKQVPRRQEAYNTQFTRLWDLSGKIIAELDFGGQSLSLNESFSPDGKQIITVGQDGMVQLWNLSGNKIDQFKGHLGAVVAVDFDPSGKLVATGGKDGTVRLWNLSIKPVIQLADYPGAVGFNFSQNSRNISIAGMLDNTIRIYNLSGITAEFKGTPDNIATTITRPTIDGEHFVTVERIGAKKGRATLHDLSGNLISELKTTMNGDMDSPVSNRIFGQYIGFKTFSASFDGHIVATIGTDLQTRIWDFSKQKVIELRDPQGTFSSNFKIVRVSPDGTHILTIGGDHIVRLWNSSGKPLVKLDGTIQNSGKIVEAVGLGIVLDGTRITQIAKNSPAMKAGLKADDIILTINEKYILNDDEIYSLLNGQEGTQVTLRIVRGKLGNTQGLDFSINREKVRFLFGKTYTNAEFSPDGKYIATWDTGGNTVQLWDIFGNSITELTGLDRVISVSFDPSKKLFSTQGLGNSVQVWDFYGKLITELKGFLGPSATRFSPDGQRIATLGGDRIIRIWDILGRKVAQSEYTFGDFMLDFSPDGKYVVAQKDDNGAITLLPVEELEELLASGCNWLKSYFLTHPEVQNTLYVCQYPSILAKMEENFSKIKEIEKTNVKFHIEQGRNFAEIGEFDNALTEFQKAQELAPNLGFDPETEAKQIAAQSWLEKGVTLARDGEIEGASVAYIKAEEISPMIIPANHWNYLCWRGSSDSFHREPLKVMNACGKAIEVAEIRNILDFSIENILDPSSADIYRDARGLALAQTGYITGAIEDFEAFLNWIEKNKGRFSNDEARIFMAQKLQRQYWLNALRHGENPFSDNGDFALLNLSEKFRVDFYYLGQVAEWENDLNNALYWYKKVNQGTNYLNARTRVAVILNSQGKFEEAIEYLHSMSLFGRDEKLEPSLVQTVVDFVFHHNRYAEAMEIYEHEKSNGYPSLRIFFIKAMLAYKMDNLIKYEQELRKVIETEQQWQKDWEHKPHILYIDALNHLGYTLVTRTNRYQEAHDLLKQALELEPENPFILDSMGWVLYKMGKSPESLEYLRKAYAKIDASVSPESVAETASHLGEVLWASGEKEEAKIIWKKALEDFPDNQSLREVVKRFWSDFERE